MGNAFAGTLRQIREDRGVSQKKAAGDLQISQALLSHYEHGIRECGLDFLIQCARYYRVSADELLGLRGQREQPENEPEKAIREIGNLLEQLLRQQDAVRMEPLADWLILQVYRVYAFHTETSALFTMDRADALERVAEEMQRLERQCTCPPGEQTERMEATAPAPVIVAYVEGRLKGAVAQDGSV